jgi:AbrB family looped-hinge helix DNA binding protein
VTNAAGEGKAQRQRRVVIPAALRKALDLRPGDELILRVEDGELRLSTRRQALARARRMIREYIPSDEDLTQSLIDDRRAEAGRE